MDALSATSMATSQASDSFYSTVIKNKDPEKLAGQFESIYYRMIFQEMRKSPVEDDILGSSQMQQVMSMFDDELSMQLGEAGHLGFKEQIIGHLNRTDPSIMSKSSQGMLKAPKRT